MNTSWQTDRQGLQYILTDGQTRITIHSDRRTDKDYNTFWQTDRHKFCNTSWQTDRQTDWQTDRQTDTRITIHPNRRTDKDYNTFWQTDRQGLQYVLTDEQTQRFKYILTDRQTDRQTQGLQYILTDRQKDIHKDCNTSWQTDRRTYTRITIHPDRQTETEKSYRRRQISSQLLSELCQIFKEFQHFQGRIFLQKYWKYNDPIYLLNFYKNKLSLFLIWWIFKNPFGSTYGFPKGF